MSEGEGQLKRIVFEACLAAVWTDSSMSADEQHYLSHLIETLGVTEQEREGLRDMRHQAPNEARVLADVAALDTQAKAYVFDTCLELLASDRKLSARELAFLGALRKACGIGFWAYLGKRLRAQRKAKARAAPPRWVLVVIALTPLLCLAYFFSVFFLYEEVVLPTETGGGGEILVAVLDPAAPGIPTLPSGQEVFESSRESIVTVVMYLNRDFAGSGSGFVLGSDASGIAYVVTNRHVAHNSRTENSRPDDVVNIIVEQFAGARFDAELDFFSREHDLAILAVEGMAAYTKPLVLSLKGQLRVGQPVYAVGSPLGLDHTFTAGVVSALRDGYLQTDATIHSGSSGGPLLDAHGALCGVMTASHRAKDYSFALYADMVLEALEERRALAAATSE